METAIIDTTLLTMRDDRLGIIEDGALGIEGNELAYVGPNDEFDPTDAEEVIDGSGSITMPGLINGHMHTRHTIVRGGAQDVPEIEWMNKAVGPLTNHVTGEDRIVSSRLGVIESLQAGATTFVEYAGEVADLVDTVYLPFGARVVATETINEVPDDRADLGPRDLYPFDRSKGEAALDRANALFEDYDDEPLVSAMYGAHAMDMLSAELLETIKAEALERDSRIHMHVAQGGREQLQIEERYGESETTVSVLEDLDMLGEFLIAAHCHGTSPEERERMVAAGVNMAGCPSSIGMIDGIVPPVHHFTSLGGLACIGTDQAPGPGHHNMFREARTASLLSKVDHTDPTALPAWKALRLATIEGATVLNLDDRVGSLEEGKRADVITVDVEQANMTPVVSEPLKTYVPNLIYSTTGHEVSNVFIDGNAILRQDEFVDIDAEGIVEEANDRAKRVFADAEADWRAAGSELVDRVDEGWL